MMNRAVAIVAFLTLVAFLSILLIHVPRLDLGLVIGFTLLMVLYDLWLNAGERDSKKG